MSIEYKRYSGNRFSLRSKTNHIIKRIDFISNRLGALGELLVTTMESLLITLFPMAFGLYLVFHYAWAEHGKLIKPNLIPIALIILGTFLVCLNTLMVNPSFGSQFLVSIKFLSKKISTRNERKGWTKFFPYRMYKDINDKSVLETRYKGRKRLIVMYQVRGSVSNINFESDLEYLAKRNSQLLRNMERNTVITTVNSIQSTKIELKNLPDNATPAMIRKRDLNHKITSNLRHNQQIDTKVVIAAPDEDVLRARIESIETAFRQGLVIGYHRIKGDDLKKSFYEIYGEMK
ncbi:hypothetical protein [Enterococcus mundtii]|uniref:hypothetical protein n=1 Tax=Enterococcus mundtii TaxID=53346 RepID=UPI000E06163D|nr:hypothetical protein [Enterococcus mundtii]STE38125.1 Uncharacterised protein [Enterococcus mundtii]